jgi:1,4-alpha-glucan branching enzyme
VISSEVSLLSDDDLFLFNEGNHYRLYEKLGAHLVEVQGRAGTYFAVWAPNAAEVCLAGDFNHWRWGETRLHARGSSGIWEAFVPGLGNGTLYKFLIKTPRGQLLEKSDPFAVHGEIPPKTASVVWDLSYRWQDGDWMRTRDRANALTAPWSVYEVHSGSWRRIQEGWRSLGYRELGRELAAYVTEMGFTHVEFLPVMEHPFFGSWGYQTTGYFQPSSRYGTPQDLMACIEALHQAGIGVLLDWVPSHFPTDAHGLGLFDGTHLFEHADPRQGFHPDWQSYIFNYGRNEVRSFLLSSALFWLDRYHADGLRVDAVASMLYLDYSRKPGEWVPNQFGGRENLAAIDLFRRLNSVVYENHPDVQTVAEESTAWPMVSRPTYVGGLGFGMKWDMGWMHDTLDYFRHEPIHRKYHHDRLTFRMLYAFTENYMLPLSHDEVVYGKGSLLAKMPGDDWQKFANLRLLFAYMYAQPGKKLLFMGGEFGQWQEWAHDGALQWDLLERAPHRGMQRWLQDLNRALRQEAALHELDFDPAGFSWIDCNDSEQSIIVLLRKAKAAGEVILGAFNFTPVPRHNYRVGVPEGGSWREILNSDAHHYGGSGQGNMGSVEAVPVPMHGHDHSLTMTLPPLGAVFFKPDSTGT